MWASRNSEGFKIKKGSVAANNGLPFDEPVFPMAGKGIFKHIPAVTTHDMYGNNVDMPNDDVNIGAYNGDVVDQVSTAEIQAPREQLLNIYPNPVKDKAAIQLTSKRNGFVKCSINGLNGKLIHEKEYDVSLGNNTLTIVMPSTMTNGFYFLRVGSEMTSIVRSFILNR